MANSGPPCIPPLDGIISDSASSAPSGLIGLRQNLRRRTNHPLDSSPLRDEGSIYVAGTPAILSARTHLLLHADDFSTPVGSAQLPTTSNLPLFPALSSLGLPNRRSGNYRAVPVVRLRPRCSLPSPNSPRGVDSIDIT